MNSQVIINSQPTLYSQHSSTNNTISSGSSSNGINSLEENTFEDSTTLSSLNKLPLNAATHNRAEIDPSDALVAEKEEKDVARSKLLVIVVLVLVLTGLMIFVNIAVFNVEYATFKSEYQNFASEVITISQQNVKNTQASMESFSDTISSYASATNQPWPFVTVQDFEARGQQILDITKGSSVHILPLVTSQYKSKWEAYTIATYEKVLMDRKMYKNLDDNITDVTFRPFIYTLDIGESLNFDTFGPDETGGPYLPLWQIANGFDISFYAGSINWNALVNKDVRDAYQISEITKKTSLSFFAYTGSLLAHQLTPIFEKVTQDKSDQEIVGYVWLTINFLEYFQDILPAKGNGIDVVLEGRCGDSITYKQTYSIDGSNATLKGEGDLHERQYDKDKVTQDFLRNDIGDNVVIPDDMCDSEIVMYVYPTDKFRQSYVSNRRFISSAVLASTFLLACLVFISYDYSIGRRQAKVMDRIMRQHKIVSGMFPAKYRDQMYASNTGEGKSNRADSEELDKPKQMADLFPSASVIFSDIAGFTAWSSTREPTQVFTLLETIYGAFDQIAYRHSIFKVETIGDCYVAVCGLPEPRADHVVAIAHFARDCMQEMVRLTQKLEMTLGPDTADLAMRIGIHSGQVTAGVLRGEKSRFQLFGDTVNVAARMETTGVCNRIHISNTTADLLRKYGKSKWIKTRKDRVLVKGKGQLQTFWLETRAETQMRKFKRTAKNASHVHMKPLLEVSEENNSFKGEEEEADSWENEEVVTSEEQLMTRTQRLVEWNVDTLCSLLKQVVASRIATSPSSSLSDMENKIGRGRTVLEEFKNIITLPKISAEEFRKRKQPESIDLGEKVVSQLRDYITNVAHMYQENHFHNFEHASHVTSSVRKMLSRIVNRNDPTNRKSALQNEGLVDITCHSYGITSDPLTQFAVVLSAVIHDADHPGVPNTQLVVEKVPMAAQYKGKSVAEQNSVSLAWTLLMEPQYKDLRTCIYSNEAELKRFRQLVVNTVMATDITDKEFAALRKNRWAIAFSDTNITSKEQTKTIHDRASVNRKATIVIEHLIQASDVSHTMQHWQVYKKWNERFFQECYSAYKNGRAKSDPSDGWYKGEIGFFDFYVIPLAKKLESCGVFGVSSQEYLNYALANREEWAMEGEALVKEYISNYEKLGNNMNGTGVEIYSTDILSKFEKTKFEKTYNKLNPADSKYSTKMNHHSQKKQINQKRINSIPTVPIPHLRN